LTLFIDGPTGCQANEFDANSLTTQEGFRVWRPGLMIYRDAWAHQQGLDEHNDVFI
jgi:hypothetical protein